MAEALHHQIGGKAQAGEFLQFVAGHRPGGVLRADRGHARLAISAGTHTLHAAGATDHLLRQGITLAGILFIGATGRWNTVGRRQAHSARRGH